MYWYYAKSLSKSGESKLLNLFKPVITFLQIAQFITGFYFLWQYPRTVPCFRKDAYKMIGIYYYTWTYVGLVLLLFINFFLRTYLCRGKKPRSDGERPSKDKPKKPSKENPKDK
jgi:hypothetical protein